MTVEEKINIVHNLGYKFIDDPYIIESWKNIHIADEDGYKYRSTISDLKRNKIPTKIYKKNIYLRDNLENYFKLNAPDCNFIDVDINDVGKEVKFTCNNHLDKGIMTSNIKNFQMKEIRNTKTMCPYCGKISGGIKNSIPDSVILERCKELDIEFIGKERSEKNGNLIIQFICNKHREKGVQRRQWDDIKNAKYSCYYCNPLHKLTMEECKDELRDMMELRKYHILSLTNSSEITCECDVCGHVWTAIIGNLKQGTGCPKCKKSRGEEKIEKWLDDNSVSYIREYKFPDCKNKRELPFDFYLPEHNICIEYQGIQHYKPCTLHGISQKEAEHTLLLQQQRDAIKKQFCLENNIYLLEIPYTNFPNIDNILQKEIA